MLTNRAKLLEIEIDKSDMTHLDYVAGVAKMYKSYEILMEKAKQQALEAKLDENWHFVCWMDRGENKIILRGQWQRRQNNSVAWFDGGVR